MASPELIREWCGGQWITAPADNALFVEELATDSRRINDPAHAAFIAICTGRRDGHSFIRLAYDAGVRFFIISKPIDTTLSPGAAFLLVNDGIAALQAIAAGHRAQFHIPVIGITGSNGKTVVKEWLYQTLSEDRSVVRSPKSYNSQIGVPLSVWLMEPQHQIAIFEAGLSQPGEMDALEQIIRPTIGIFTNVGAAHSEGFASNGEKIAEKLKLFRHAQTIIYCCDYEELHEHIQKRAKSYGQKLFSWSAKSGKGDLIITFTEHEAGVTRIGAEWAEEDRTIDIPFTDAASIENAIHVWCTLLYLGLDDATIAARMAHLQPIEMRLQMRRGANGCTLINDAYNSDLTALAISLDYLESLRQHRHRSVILSDVLQMGGPEAALYEEVAQMLSRRGIRRLFGIGPAISRNAAAFDDVALQTTFFQTTEAFLQALPSLHFEEEAILLKGARPFRFERIAAALEEEVHQTELSVSLSALAHNLAVFRGIAGPGVKVMAMVKAFSYGSGSYEIASALQFGGVDYLSVAYTDEGIALRKGGITLPIMVMSPEPDAFDRMIAGKLEPEIYNFRSLKAFVQAAKARSMEHYPVHIKLDTGMHRLGFEPGDMDALKAALGAAPQLKVASVFSHLAAAEDAAMDDFTARQAALFAQMSEAIIDGLGYTPPRHLCNTAGIARHPQLHYDMVRLGLGLYGIDSSGSLAGTLQQVSTLRSTIAQIKTLPAGEGIGYGHSDAVEHERRIATVSIGYADGYPRALGHGRAHLLIHGRPAPLVGVVCMDMCMADITAIPEAAEGDEVIVWGPELPLALIASWAGTIPYEIMTGVSGRVRRVYVAE